MGAIGYSKYAPGTVASFITCMIYIFFYSYEINIFLLIFFVSLIFIYSVYAIDNLKINSFDQVDAKEIVIDEFVGQSIPILTLFFFLDKYDIHNFLLYTLFSFFFFRFFDIIKPYPINRIDKKMKNGFGVMLDDVLAGIYTSIILLAIIVFVNYE